MTYREIYGIDGHVIQTPVDTWQGNGLYQPQGELVPRVDWNQGSRKQAKAHGEQ
jgi:hypothetical protein